MTDNIEYNLWRENFLGVFRQISSDEDFKKLASFYPYNDYTDNKCKQRKNNLLRSGNRNVYLDDLYACYALSFTGGATLKWFRDNFAELEQKKAEEEKE